MNHCFPLRLQDLCLLVIVSELVTYPVNLLAALPLWLRSRLFHCLPVLDLCRLESTTVARGIDTSGIWSSKRTYKGNYSELWEDNMCSGLSCLRLDEVLGGTESELVVAYERLKQQVTNTARAEAAKEWYLLQIALFILEGDHETAFDWFVSINGDMLLRTLTQLSIDCSEVPYRDSSECPCFMWNKQDTILVQYESSGHIQLIPRRYTSLRDKPETQLEQAILSLLTFNCGLQPPCFYLELDDSCDVLLEDGASAMTKHLLGNVVILFLSNTIASQLLSSRWWTPYRSHLSDLMEIVVGNGKVCHLKALALQLDMAEQDFERLSPYLFTLPCDPEPPRYQGLCAFSVHAPIQHLSILPCLTTLLEQQVSLEVVHVDCIDMLNSDCDEDVTHLVTTLSKLFSRPHFRLLQIAMYTNTFYLNQLVKGFMTASCLDHQELVVQVLKPYKHDPTQLAALDITNCTIPECGVEHKIFRGQLNASSINEKCLNSSFVTHALLQLSTVRLQQLHLVFASNCPPVLHLAALHPDLRVSALTVSFSVAPQNPAQLLSTLPEDFKALFRMPTLREVTLMGEWTSLEEAKHALLLGLEQQLQIRSIRKIKLDASDHSYGTSEFKELWDALFSLPQLDQVEVIITRILSVTVNEFAHVVRDSWQQCASGRKLKSLKLEFENETNLDVLDIVTHKN